MISIMVFHLECKHGCFVEKNVTTAIFCPIDDGFFLRVLVKKPVSVYVVVAVTISATVDWFSILDFG